MYFPHCQAPRVLGKWLLLFLLKPWQSFIGTTCLLPTPLWDGSESASTWLLNSLFSPSLWSCLPLGLHYKLQWVKRCHLTSAPAQGLAGDNFQVTVERNHNSDAEIIGKFGGGSQGPLLPTQWKEEILQAVPLLHLGFSS